MSKIIRTRKPSVLPFYAMALVFLVLCAVLPVYKLWALLAALGGAFVAFGAAQKVCPPRVVEHEVPFHTGVEDVDAMLTDIQQKLDTLHTLNEQLPDPQLSAAMTRMEKAGRSHWGSGGGKNTDNIFVSDATTVAVGDKISLLGTKSSDSQKLATVIDCDEVTVLSGGAVNYPEPEDISAKIDDYTSSKRGYVTVKGVFNGSTLTVSEDAKYSVSVVDAPSSLGLSSLTGHIVTVTGYYAGLAEPVQRIMATDVEDNGLNEIVYFLENFEWLEPWSVASGVGQTVETDNLDAKATALTSITVDGVTAFDAVEKLGYKFIYDKNDNKRIYLQQNYLKFGKTGNHAGIILPPIDGVPEAKDNVTLSFDWCGMRQGSGKIDPVNLIVIFENGSDKVQIDIPELGWEDGHKLEWVRAEVSLKGITVNKDTKITITQTQWEVGTANRWFLDNIKISEPIKL